MKAIAYICYLPNPEQHTNTAGSHAGIGTTREEAYDNAVYWPNQEPWVRIVPISRAPRWAIEEAEDSLIWEEAEDSRIREEATRMNYWNPTHRINSFDYSVEVMLTDDGAAYTEPEWRHFTMADYEVNDDGEWLFHGQPFDGSVEEISQLEKRA